MFARFIALFSLLLAPVVAAQPAATTPVTAPLTVPFAFLETLAAKQLEMDATGVSVLGENACRQVELSDLVIIDADTDTDTDTDTDAAPRLQASMAVLARAGVGVFGACRGPGPVTGRLRFFLDPGVAESGSAAVFAVTGAEFRSADGSESLLTRPSRALAESIVVPRLQAMEVDVQEPLAQIDDLLERFIGTLPGGIDPLAARGRLEGLRVTPKGLEAELGFTLAGASPADEEATAPVAALDEAELAQWESIEDEFDGFITVLVADLASRTQKRDLQLDLAALLIDARLRINELLLPVEEGDGTNADEDPLRVLFIESWSTLAAVAGEIAARDSEAGQSLRMASFVAAGDALQIADRVGPLYGIEISRDGLRRLARVLLADGAPASFTPLPLTPDAALQALFRIDPDVPPADIAAPATSWLRRLSPIAPVYAQAPDPALLLREIFPQRDNLDSYLAVVAQLIAQTLDEHWEESRLTTEQRRLFDPLVRATAWKETCWRHYLQEDGEVAVIRSGIGAVGMMQIVGRVWRSLFDLERLERDVDYNLAAGIDILEHYFVDYALRKGEHEQPGGTDNLVRATYSAYNAGPSKLARYRQESAPARARAVDGQFYDEYRRMLEQPWPSQSRCYAP